MSSVNPLPVSEILAYTTMVGIASSELRSKYLKLIQRMDRVLLEHYAEKQATK